jgi:hypothetical protein
MIGWTHSSNKKTRNGERTLVGKLFVRHPLDDPAIDRRARGLTKEIMR